MQVQHPIGIFDSGYGGLTVMKEIVSRLPQYDYLYLGDNARAPYGNRSFETVYRYTLESVQWFFGKQSPLVILACNTASAKALRSIQQQDLPRTAPDRRVLGVIRPTTEIIGNFTKTGKVGILATYGTVQSNSYPIEIAKFFPDIRVYQQACPMWVPLVENNEHNSPGADYFIQECVDRLLAQDSGIDAILLACTHYPLMQDRIREHLPSGIRVLSQGPMVAESLADYLLRHPEMEKRISRGEQRSFFTTDEPSDFDAHAGLFFGESIRSKHISIS